MGKFTETRRRDGEIRWQKIEEEKAELKFQETVDALARQILVAGCQIGLSANTTGTATISWTLSCAEIYATALNFVRYGQQFWEQGKGGK